MFYDAKRFAQHFNIFFQNLRIYYLKCPYDQIFGITHFYVFVKSITFLYLTCQISNPYEHGKLSFSTVFIQDYTAAINQACSRSDVKDSKLKTTWLIILI